METDANQRAIDLIYKLFLNLVAISHVLFAIRSIIFYFSIVSLPGANEEPVYLFYMIAAIVGAFLNIAIVIIIKKRPFSSYITIILFFLNVTLINVYFVFNSIIFSAFFDFLIVVTFSLVSISAGMFVGHIWAGLISFYCALSLVLYISFRNIKGLSKRI